MNLFDTQLLNLTIFFPLIIALFVAILPSGEKGQIRVVTLIGMLVGFLLSLWSYLRFAPGGPEFQLETRAHWIPAVGISYHTGVDGLAVSLVLLTGFLGPVAVLASWTFINERVKEFHLALLLLQTAMIGALCSLDIILFYIFWEAMLVPMYLLIGVWGSEERQMAAMKFFLYTLAGSLLMLVAILAVYFLGQAPGARSFDYATMYNSMLGATRELSTCLNTHAAAACTNLSPLALAIKSYGIWMFLAFAISFAIKVPMFPVHTWLPDAHVQAPVAGSIILAGVLLKMGTFGFWRYAIPLFPVVAREVQPYFMALAVVGIIYGALMCMAQRDIKKLIAYSSVSHLGYCMLGIFALTAEGVTGGAYQMLNHGVSTGALFLLFGYLYERRHTRLMSEYGGIAKVMPLYAACFVIITFSSVAVPGTNGFVGEFLVLMGTFKSGLSVAFGVLGAVGVILGAVYMLYMVQRVFFGQVTQRENLGLRDLGWREALTVAPFILLVLVMGIAPQQFLNRLEVSSKMLVERGHYAAADSNLTPDMVRMHVMPLPPEEQQVAERLPLAPAHVVPAALAVRH